MTGRDPHGGGRDFLETLVSEPSDRKPQRDSPGSAELARLREEIDAIDQRILATLNERARRVCEVGELKARFGLPVYSAARERDLVRHLEASNSGPFPDAAIADVFTEIISATRSLERRLRVAYLGPPGTFGHQAARNHFGASVDFVPVSNHGEVFRAVERGEVDRGVVPVENTTHGIVTETFDALAETQVAIGAETLLPVTHHLLSQSGELDRVKCVVSHPQALGQCRRWLADHLHDVAQRACASTALAAQSAAEDESLAAVGSAVAGEIYGLLPIATGIEDQAGNQTRFLVIGGEPPPPSGDDLTLAIYATRAQSGSLYRLLEPFAKAGVNLSAIQSRPMPGRAWEYLFYLDIDGHPGDPKVAGVLAESGRIAQWFRVLGAFPRAARTRADRLDGSQAKG